MRIAAAVIGTLTALALWACGQSESDKSNGGSTGSSESSAKGSSAGITESSAVGPTTNGQLATTGTSTAGGTSSSTPGADSGAGSGGSTPASASAGGAASSDNDITTGANSDALRCVPEGAFCRALPGPCPDFQVREVDGDCWGECVPIEACICDEPADCPDENQYTCHNSAGHCGPYLM